MTARPKTARIAERQRLLWQSQRRPSSMLRAASVALSLLLMTAATSGCCRILDLLPKPVIEEDDDIEADDEDGDILSPKPNRPRRATGDLGDAAYPAGNNSPAVEHRWTTTKLTPRKYRLGYKLTDTGEQSLDDDFHHWARRLGYKKLNKTRFQWRPPRRCFGGLHCVYEELVTQQQDAVEPLAKLFDERIKAQNLDAMQAASLVVTFGQEIKYRIPHEQPFGVMPPALVVERKNGDCDSKSLIVHMILRKLGIDSVLISSKAHAHTMLGIALPAPGKSFTHNSRRYAFVELTAKRSPIGHINPKLLRPNDWRVDVFANPGGKGSSPTKPKHIDKGKRSVETPMNAPLGGPIRIQRR